ncbi:MAG: DUF45 domain-containing protein, partial [Thermostichus sp. DG_1_6_bins_120]
RDRRVILKYSPHKGWQLVLPTGFDRSRIPDILHNHSAWIQQQLQRPVQSAPFCQREPAYLLIPRRTVAAKGLFFTDLYRPSSHLPSWQEQDGILLLNRGQENPLSVVPFCRGGYALKILSARIPAWAEAHRTN